MQSHVMGLNLIGCNQFPKCLKKYLQRLAHKVRNHLYSAEVFNFYISLFNIVHHREIMNVNWSVPLSWTIFSVLLQYDCYVVVLVDNTLIDIDVMCFHKYCLPQNYSKYVVSADQFILGTAPSVQFFFLIERWAIPLHNSWYHQYGS